MSTAKHNKKINKKTAFNEYHMSPATEEIHNILTSEEGDEA